MKFEGRGRELAETNNVPLEICSRRKRNWRKNGEVSGRRDGWIEGKRPYRLQLKKSEEQQVSCLTHFCTSGMKTSLFNLFFRTALWNSFNKWGGTMTSTGMFRPLTPVQKFNFQRKQQHEQT